MGQTEDTKKAAEDAYQRHIPRCRKCMNDEPCAEASRLGVAALGVDLGPGCLGPLIAR